jgi:glycosyltransferase involved in cell wall biosynthesis
MAESGISIVIPTRDRGRFLRDAVASALSAPESPLEVIVADDGSTDGSVAEAQTAHPSIRVVQGPFGNAARARNAGAAEARGDVLGFLDSDDLMLPGKTGPLVERLRADPGLALVHGTTQVIGADGARDAASTARQQATFTRGAEIGLDYPGLAQFCAMYTSATAIRRETFFAVGGFDESLDAYEDWDLYLRLSLVGRLAYTDDLAACYRVWPGNVAWSRTAEWTAHVAKKHLDGLPPLGPRDETRARYGLHRRLVESHNVLGEMRAVRHEAITAARIAPTRAVLDLGLWRPLVRALIPPPLLPARGRPPEELP